MNCEIKLDEYGVYTTENGSGFYKEQPRKGLAFSEEDVIGITVIAAFLATATWFTMRGYHEPFFFLLVPMLFFRFCTPNEKIGAVYRVPCCEKWYSVFGK